jgi:hypothetical protein
MSDQKGGGEKDKARTQARRRPFEQDDDGEDERMMTYTNRTAFGKDGVKVRTPCRRALRAAGLVRRARVKCWNSNPRARGPGGPTNCRGSPQRGVTA